MAIKIGFDEEYLKPIKMEYIRQSSQLVLFMKAGRLFSDSEVKEIEDSFQAEGRNLTLHLRLEYEEDLLTEDFWTNYAQEIWNFLLSLCPGLKGLKGGEGFVYRQEDETYFCEIANPLIHKSIEKMGVPLLLRDRVKSQTGREKNFVFHLAEEMEDMSFFEKQREENLDSLIKSMDVPTGEKDKKPSVKKEQSKGDIILGRKIAGESLSIEYIKGEGDIFVTQGRVFSLDKRITKSNKYIYTFNIKDKTSALSCKAFVSNEDFALKKGDYIKLRGRMEYDTYAKEDICLVNDISLAKEELRMDEEEIKRIELHAHTTMTSMEGIVNVKDLIKKAAQWGHKAIGITDDGVVQAFPDAMDEAKKSGVKVLYGLEAHLVDDMAQVLKEVNEEDMDQEFVVFDIETTGFSSTEDSIIEIGAVKIKEKQIVDHFSELINPNRDIPPVITELTGITNAMVYDKDPIEIVLPKFMEFSKGCVFVAHNSDFDTSFIREKCKNQGLDYDHIAVDTVELSRALLTDLKRHKLDVVTKKLGISLENHHRAVDDAEATAQIFLKFVSMLEDRGVERLSQVNEKITKTNIQAIRDTSITIFAKDLKGLKNLYRLVSFSHIKHFYRVPRILKSELLKYRQGLLLGTGGESGEVFSAVRDEFQRGTSTQIVEKLLQFYDFAEIMPTSTYRSFFSARYDLPTQLLEKINKRIWEAASEAGLPTVAVGNVHYLDEEDGIYRHILRHGQKKKDEHIDKALYYRTTREMLDEFSYLGEEVAKQVVIDNTHLVADMIEDLLPVPDGTFPPEIEGAKEDLRNMCYEKAKRIYGENLPELVEKRLERELNSIIGNGYAVMYIIAQKLVTKSLRDGYLVGSRGSVGSSFAATMSDITEVNPLPPHYICPNEECKYSEFLLDGSIGSGADMPDKSCPKCGHKLTKEGFDIPFEVFLGFEGDKEPDIDLNFAGEYQPNAHRYVEELFGEGYVFRAGTIGTIAEKTAFGYVAKYLEENGIRAGSAQLQKLQLGCTGIKRTSGQHPGGVMVCPKNKDIYDFTPIQYPANDSKSGVITTHFDYHSISGRILKLDILGHDGPSIIRHLEDMTGLVATELPLDDQRTMSIFTSTEALGCDLSKIDCETGSLGIPEFGTRFVRQMLMDTQPHTLAELVRISGLSHGTDVWVNNAQDLVRGNVATLKEVISTRDDIMNYLIQKGLPSKMSFKIMESVRKGKGITDEWEEAMFENNVPSWYINSCKKIKYMFPKAHAAAYVMMSFRIAYFKVYQKEAFYAATFTTKVADFDIELISGGEEAVLKKFLELKKEENTLTTKEKDMMTVLELAYEMYRRGVKLKKVDIYHSHAQKFHLEDGMILPPLMSIQGLGMTVAEKIQEEAKKAEFISLEDFRKRTKASKTVVETLLNHGCLAGLPETNQLCMF